MKCITCYQEKPDSEFTKTRGTGLGKRCFACRANVAKAGKSFFKRNPDYQPPNPYVYQQSDRFKRYGMTQEDYDYMAVSQNNQCSICKREVYLVVDHCHESGNVRELLCNRCNTGIGLFKDNPVFLEAARDYVIRHAAKYGEQGDHHARKPTAIQATQ